MLLEKRNIHPLDNVMVGLELEFAADITYDDAEKYKEELGLTDEDIEGIKTKPYRYSSIVANKIMNFHVVPLLREHFASYEIEVVPAKAKYELKPNDNKLVATFDNSINLFDEKGFIIGFELITPPFFSDYGDNTELRIRDIIKSFDDMLEDSPFLKTDEYTGLHVNMSLVTHPLTFFQALVLRYLYDTSYMTDSPETRKKYADNIYNILKNTNILPPEIKKDKTYREFVIAYEQRENDRFEKLMKLIEKIHSLKRFKYSATSPRANYVEFRPIGGPGYENNVDQIVDKIRVFAVKMKESLRELDRKAKRVAAKIFRHIQNRIRLHSRKVGAFLRRIPDLDSELKNEISEMLNSLPPSEWGIALLKFYRANRDRFDREETIQFFDALGSLIGYEKTEDVKNMLMNLKS